MTFLWAGSTDGSCAWDFLIGLFQSKTVWIFSILFFGPYSDVLSSGECQTKSFKYVVKCSLFSKPFSNFVWPKTMLCYSICNLPELLLA